MLIFLIFYDIFTFAWQWNEVFNDPALTAAMVDRLTHKSYILNMSGNSYRIKETQDWMGEIN